MQLPFNTWFQPYHTKDGCFKQEHKKRFARVGNMPYRNEIEAIENYSDEDFSFECMQGIVLRSIVKGCHIVDATLSDNKFLDC